ncbi:MAG TPA: GNAT family N-acetyltransferase [Cytophagales bacterium]|nr:GNAT family N-acetyltransferase [Cytophagales bacterium]HAA17317.1 GNAT family N-acetyltransferase [Cytophagales bacterium]HAP62979.1 GNAT family N-acetyltransferase [Cytophagales bacterium]
MPVSNSFQVIRTTTAEELNKVFAIREEVFVVEQEVEPEEEFDEFEETSYHFLGLDENGEPAGCARWRFTDNGVKLERFAVRKAYRGKGMGGALVQAVLDDIGAHSKTAGKKRYLHAQLPAMPLYARFGFEKEGDLFLECDIEHYTMVQNSY